MCPSGRFLTCVLAVLATASIAAAQAPRDGRSDQEGDAQRPGVRGFGNDFETRPVPGFGDSEKGPGERPNALLSRSGGNRAAIGSSPPVVGPRPSGTPPAHGTKARPAATRFHTAAELLPAGLPDWFRTRDANGDGQIAMAEYAQDWNDAKVRDYRKWDLDDNGVIVPAEALKVLGIDAPRQAKSSAKPASAPTQVAASAAVRSPEAIQARNERRAESVVRTFLTRYDRDGSGALEAAEWADLPWQDASRWDADRDRRLTADEIAARFAGPQRW